MKIRRALSALITISTALVAFALLAGAAGAVTGVPVWRLTQRTSQGPTWPHISGSKAVWTQWGSTSADIFVDDLTTGTRHVIGRNGMLPRISGSKVVWMAVSTGSSIPVYLYDLTTGVKRQIGSGALVSSPVVSGNYVAWAVMTGPEESQVYLHRIDTGVTTKLTSSAVPKIGVGVGGGKLVWAEINLSNFSTTLIAHDIPSSTETTISTSLGEIYDVDVEPMGKSFVYSSFGGGADPGIYEYDFTGGSLRRLTATQITQREPSVYGNRVVWTDDRNSGFTENSDIYVFDLITGVERRLTDNATPQYSPDIYGNKVVWGDMRYSLDGSGEDVMLADISRLDMTPPVTSMITNSYSTRSSKTGTFKVSWTGSDPSPSEGGIVAWNVQVKTGSGGTWSYLRSNTTDRYAYINGRPGHTYYFRVRAKDTAGIWGNWSPVRSTTVPYDDRSAAAKIGFAGIWANSTSEHFLGTIRYSRATSDTVEFSFRGSRVAFITDKAFDHSEANIYIDGVFQSKVDTYAATQSFRQSVFEKAFPSIGNHRITVENVGTPGRKRLDVDAFAVIN